jgi:hypothetical protein
VTRTPSAEKVDVAAMPDRLDKEDPEDLDWRRSIVDLMKLLKLDSSLKARKELANELGYDGNMSDSAKMNTWLHKQVMTRLAEHGGIVPDELNNKAPRTTTSTKSPTWCRSTDLTSKVLPTQSTRTRMRWPVSAVSMPS